MHRPFFVSCLLATMILPLSAPTGSAQQRKRLPAVGYENRPELPGQPWRVHDWRRPRPPKIDPVQNGAPPSDAIVLFDGTDLSQWYQRGKGQNELLVPKWKVADGYMEVAPRTGSIYSIESFGDIQLHIEWALPPNPNGDGQGRANSGIKLMGAYEVQVLDSFDNRTYADGQAGSLYGQYPPLVNASLPPGEWQTYDIIFEAPRFTPDGELESPAFLTVLFNGVLVHHRRQLYGPTGAARADYREGPPAGQIMLQDHGNPIRYRNIWARRLKLDSK